MAPKVADDMFSSSPTHPSHHRTQLLTGRGRKPDAGPSGFPSAATRNPLKRSASNASLLTPPSSPEKEKAKDKRSAKRTLSDSDDEDEDGDEVMASPGRRPTRTRNARTVVKERRAQAVFGPQQSMAFVKGAGRGAGTSVLPAAKPKSKSKSPERMALDRMRTPTASPRQANTPRMDVESPKSLPPAPTTPTRRSTRARVVPVRDSPNNPFLGSSPRAPASLQPLEERPNITYVFRGVKTTFKNPLFGGPDMTTQHRANLRPEDPDFSPDLTTAPKLLFPSAPESPEPSSSRLRSLRPRVSQSPSASPPSRTQGRQKRRKVDHVTQTLASAALITP